MSKLSWVTLALFLSFPAFADEVKPIETVPKTEFDKLKADLDNANKQIAQINAQDTAAFNAIRDQRNACLDREIGFQLQLKQAQTQLQAAPPDDKTKGK